MSSIEAYNTTGGCACGAIRYELTRKPIVVHCCHCTYCQRETGSAFAFNIALECESLTLIPTSGSSTTMEPLQTPTPTWRGQSKEQIMNRCSKCLSVGVLEPNIHIFTSTKQPWVMLPEAAVVYEESYPREEVWSKETMERWENAKSRHKAQTEGVEKER
ncbi:hypothetical protein BT63DRAFT_477522 [Microthyrium microscopicum]|uniref:CENP-V/GFA domain-containing protein n=1 Tax=Microthyrium microscopicum TaxID=703497 RepID=A0A6A6UH01_9PEZI|nr:hypothetical protein BT63DRAFT_477522 [Microthyrium microscopicum]